MTDHPLTDEQRAIVEAARGTQNLLIEAVAGSGKTFAIRKALEVIPQRSILVTAFNARIADELEQTIAPPRRGWAIHVKTFHAVGRRIVAHHFPELRFDRSGTEEIIRQVGDAPYPIRMAAIKVLRKFKEVVAHDPAVPVTMNDFEEVGTTYELFDRLQASGITTACDLALAGYDLSFQPKRLKVADFCDMLWMPMALDLPPPSRYQAIVVDEWQDINQAQLSLIDRLRAPTAGRLIMAGDGRQAINGWRGAIADDVRKMMADRQARVMTLTTTFRCSLAVVKEAQRLVRGLKPCANAPEGSVSFAKLRDLPRMIGGQMARPSAHAHTFILSRSNAPLLDTALYLWREGVRFQLNAGREMLDPLFDLLDKLDLRTPDLFRKSLDKWHEEVAAQTDSIEKLDRLREQRDMLHAAVHYVAPSGLRKLFTTILEPGNTGILMSTVHKLKGMEADRVFLLRETFARHREQPDTWRDEGFVPKPPPEEELNIEYVAITRAREHLIWVEMSSRDTAIADESMLPELIRSLTDAQLEQEIARADGELCRGGEGADRASEYMKLLTEESRRRTLIALTAQ